MSCLTTSNLPWFMDLTFQVPIEYYFFTSSEFTLHHLSLLPPPVTSTTERYFRFGSNSSFFLEFLLGQRQKSTRKHSSWEPELSDFRAILRQGLLLTAGRQLEWTWGRRLQWEMHVKESQANMEAGDTAESHTGWSNLYSLSLPTHSTLDRWKTPDRVAL